MKVKNIKNLTNKKTSFISLFQIPLQLKESAMTTMKDLIDGLMALGNLNAPSRSESVRREIIEGMFAGKNGTVDEGQFLNRVRGEVIAAGDCWLILSNEVPPPAKIFVLDTDKKTLVCHDIKK